jgi:hypothetical protein
MLGRQIPAAPEQRVEKALVDAAVAFGVGIGKRGLGNLGGQAEVIKAATLREKTVLDVAQALLAVGLRVV